ncbi:MAG: MATE family efflux transporter [Christensenellales bacterium]|jgi:putative MATE family efflux protein
MKPKQQDLLFTNKAVFNLVWPIFIELGLNTAIGLVNSLMVSSLGLHAVSAVSLVDSINLLFLNVFNALAAGVTVVVSHCMGRNDKQGGDNALTQTFSIILVFSTLMALIMFSFNRPILNLMFGDAEQNVMDSAVIYNVGSVIGYPFIAVFSICAGALRATGDSRTPMMAALVSNIVNVAIGALTIMVLGWGMVGAACAVLFARATSAAILFFKVTFRPGLVNIKGFTFKIDKKVFLPVFKVGLPAAIDSLIFNGGKLVVVSFMANMGTDALAANAISNNIFNFALTTGGAFLNGGVTITGRCYGAKLYDEAKRHMRRLPLVSMVFYGLTMAIIWFFVPQLLQMYKATELAAKYVHEIVRIILIYGTITWSFSFVLPSCLRGVGDINFNTIISIISMWVFRVGLGYLLGVTFQLQVVGVWMAMMCDWGFRGICYLLRMFSNRWYKRALARDAAEAQAALTAEASPS